MERAVSVAKDDLASVRTGRATPNMFARVAVDSSAITPLNRGNATSGAPICSGTM